MISSPRFALLLALLGSPAVHAHDGESFTAYESIVNELKSDAEADLKPRHEAMDWDSVALSGSLGVAGALIDVPGAGRGFVKGFEAAVGAHVFSKRARAEFAFRNFANEQLSNAGRADVREFEARAVFLPPLTDETRLRMGLGLSERLVSVTSTVRDGFNRNGVYYGLLVGLEHQISRAVTLGPDFAYRAAVGDDRDLKSSWDASFRLNANF